MRIYARMCLSEVSMMNNHIYGPKVPLNPHFGGLNSHFKPNMRKIQWLFLHICVSHWHEFDRQLRPAIETSWVVSCDGKTIPRWRTVAISKIVISPYLSKKSSDFDEILYTAADFELDERHVIKNERVALDRLRVRRNVNHVIVVFPCWANNDVYNTGGLKLLDLPKRHNLSFTLLHL